MSVLWHVLLTFQILSLRWKLSPQSKVYSFPVLFCFFSVFFSGCVSTQPSRLRFYRLAWRSRLGHSGPQQSTVPGCCLCEPAAPWLQYGSLGPSPATGLSADRHTQQWHLLRHGSPPRSGNTRESQLSLWVNINLCRLIETNKSYKCGSYFKFNMVFSPCKLNLL